MMMKLIKNKTINDVENEFSDAYPFLRVNFYRYVQGQLGSAVRQRLHKSTNLAKAGMLREGIIEISDTMTVRQLEHKLSHDFGLAVQVSRKSGNVWLETTISDYWTLKQQNEHGRELSEPLQNDLTVELPDNI
jgi:hypothetical protein